MSIEETDGVCRILLEGKLDLAGAEAIDMRFTAVTAQRDRVAVDFSGVDYIASMGIRTLVMAAKVIGRRHGKLVLFGVRPDVFKVLSAAGVTEILPLCEDWDKARTALA